MPDAPSSTAAPNQRRDYREAVLAAMSTADIRYRRLYNARHSSVSCNLHGSASSALWASKQHGHPPETMFRAYARLTEGAP
jgi:hypothetical protein